LLLASGPTGTSVAGAWAAGLSTAEPAGLSAKQIGSRLAAAMIADFGGKVTTIVAAGRDHVQMKLLALPPAPDDELPDLVRFQAEREFTTLGEGAALDFIPLAGDAQTPRQVLAVALSPAGLAEVNELCQAIAVEPNRIALRACAAGALVNRAGIVDADKVALIVNPLTDEADLTVQAGEQVFLMRTVRLPEAAQVEARQRTLLSEIRRTVAAARQQLTDGQVDHVIVCGNRSTAEGASALADDLEIPVQLFDPATIAPPGITLHGVSDENLARFAAVMGMALSETDRRPPIVDFINVRRRPEPQRFTRSHAIAAAAAAVFVLAVFFIFWRRSAGVTNELAAVRAEIKALQPTQEQYKKVTDSAEAIERWLSTDVNWLDELEQSARRVRPQPLSAKDYPANDDVVLTQITLHKPVGRDAVGGELDLRGVAKSSAAVLGLEERLRDEQHRVNPGLGEQDNSVPGYNWLFNLEVHVDPSAGKVEAAR
jgi:hypothetical protein